MKYEEKKEYSHLLDENQVIYNVEEDSSSIKIFIKDQSKEAVCPVCGRTSGKVAATYSRTVQDTPIRNKTVMLVYRLNKHECRNEECEKKVFSGILSVAGKNQVRTFRLNHMILAVAAETSAKGAARTLRRLGVKISHDAVLELVNSTTFEDNPDVEMVGIDDVAIRKGRSYGTVIYDLRTGEPLCLLRGRGEEDVIDWLMAHQNIKVVARDRASAYASAVSKALPKAVQVADRFHLFQNLTEVLEKKFKGNLPKEVYVDGGKVIDYQREDSVFRKATKEEIAELEYDSSAPLDSEGNKVRFMGTGRQDPAKASKREARRKEEAKKIRRVREHFNNTEGATIHSTSKKFHITFYMAKKYVTMPEEEVERLQPKGRPGRSECKSAKNIAYKMFSDGWKPSVIYNYIRSKNVYHGSDSSLRQLVYSFGRKNFPELFKKEAKAKEHNRTGSSYEKLTRQDVFNLLLKQNPSEKSEELRGQLVQKIPECRKIFEVFDDFHHAIMDGDTAKLDRFLKKYEKELSSFCGGIKKDRAAVNQAISSKISSGVVEGNNTKFKLVKRIVYGRCALVNLEKKFLLYCRIDSGNYSCLGCGQ